MGGDAVLGISTNGYYFCIALSVVQQRYIMTLPYSGNDRRGLIFLIFQRYFHKELPCYCSL